MSFSSGLKFPFSNNNINKIIQIGLILGLISAVQFFVDGGQSGFGSLVALVANLAFALFVSGYGIFVMQNVIDGDETLPAFQVGESIKRGGQIFLAGIIYGLPIFIAFCGVMIALLTVLGPAIDSVFNEILLTMENPYYEPSIADESVETAGTLLLTMCGAALIFIPLAFISSYAAQIAMVRFAVEDRSGALYEFITNFKMVFANFGKILKLFLNQLGIGVIYAIASIILTSVTFTLFGASAIGGNGGIPLMALGILIAMTVISTIVSTANQMSNLHLMAGFAEETGLITGKAKNDDKYDF